MQHQTTDYARNEGLGMYFPWQPAESSESLRTFHVVFIMDSVFSFLTVLKFLFGERVHIILSLKPRCEEFLPHGMPQASTFASFGDGGCCHKRLSRRQGP